MHKRGVLAQILWTWAGIFWLLAGANRTMLCLWLACSLWETCAKIQPSVLVEWCMVRQALGQTMLLLGSKVMARSGTKFGQFVGWEKKTPKRRQSIWITRWLKRVALIPRGRVLIESQRHYQFLHSWSCVRQIPLQINLPDKVILENFPPFL